MSRESSWSHAVAMHKSAITEFIHGALTVPPEEWTSEDSNQWAPAHVMEHLTLVYEVLLKELQGGTGMKIRTNFVTQHLLRWFVVPRMLRGGPFPRARAPRETRPVLTRAKNQSEAIQIFKELAACFQEAIEKENAANPKRKLTHAYFGSGSLDATLLLCARHIQHHARGLSRNRISS
jgi:hypothetical protein